MLELLDLPARADRLATAMAYRGVTIARVAADLGVHYHTVRKVLRGGSVRDTIHHACLLWCEREERHYMDHTAPEPAERLRPLYDRPLRMGGRGA